MANDLLSSPEFTVLTHRVNIRNLLVRKESKTCLYVDLALSALCEDRYMHTVWIKLLTVSVLTVLRAHRAAHRVRADHGMS